MNILLLTLSVIAGLMVAEARLSRRHESSLRARGAVEPAGDVYGAMAVAYPLAFLLMGVEGLWGIRGERLEAWGWGLDPHRTGWFIAGLLLFVAGKGLKYWAIRALGHRWSFRVLVLPGEPLVTSGPYRYVAHPNYIGVVGELAGTAMMMEARVSGPVMLAVFGALLWARVRFENRVLA